MTPQEAITEITSKVYRNTDDFEMKISKECYEQIIYALEKRISNKPLGIYDENATLIKDNLYESALFGICPDCNSEVQDGEIFCSFCGQALDWSD